MLTLIKRRQICNKGLVFRHLHPLLHNLSAPTVILPAIVHRNISEPKSGKVDFIGGQHHLALQMTSPGALLLTHISGIALAGLGLERPASGAFFREPQIEVHLGLLGKVVARLFEFGKDGGVAGIFRQPGGLGGFAFLNPLGGRFGKGTASA